MMVAMIKKIAKIAKLMLTRATKQSPSCQDVDAAPKIDPITLANIILGAVNVTLAYI